MDSLERSCDPSGQSDADARWSCCPHLAAGARQETGGCFPEPFPQELFEAGCLCADGCDLKRLCIICYLTASAGHSVSQTPDEKPCDVTSYLTFALCTSCLVSVGSDACLAADMKRRQRGKRPETDVLEKLKLLTRRDGLWDFLPESNKVKAFQRYRRVKRSCIKL